MTTTSSLLVHRGGLEVNCTVLHAERLGAAQGNRNPVARVVRDAVWSEGLVYVHELTVEKHNMFLMMLEQMLMPMGCDDSDR